ncbi:MAG: NAD(P)-dependent oxidoreductase [Bacillota bacterium]
MFENFGEDILSPGIDSMFISVIPGKTNVLVIGGGRAGFLKSKSFAERGCNLTVVSKEFMDEFHTLPVEYKVELILDSYKKEHIKNKHLVVVAVDNKNLGQSIIHDCESSCKLYLDCSDYSNGIFGVPYQSGTEEFQFSIQTRRKNPSLSVFLGKKIKAMLAAYDDFSIYLCGVRNKSENWKDNKSMMKFMCTEDFFFFYKKGKSDTILEMFYGGKHIETKNSIKKK